jgi:hypothetical protein
MRKQAAHGEVAVAPAEDAGLPGLPDRRAVSGDRRIREDLLRLQAQMKSLAEQGALDAPRVLGLRSPNALQQKPEEAQRRVIAVLADALGSLLEMDGGAMGDPASIVLQRGWVPDGFIPSEGTYIRHLNFPATAAEDYDLLVSEDGAYYDPARQMIWSLDENGRGYLGRRVTGEDNLNAYYTPDEDTLAANRAMALAMRAEPEGFLIEDPKSNSAKVLIDQVPPPAAGYEQVVVWTDAAGHETRIPVQNTSVTAAATTPAPSPMPLAVAPMSAAPLATAPTTQDVSAAPLASIPVLPSLAQVGAGRLFFSLPDSNGVKSFSLIELPIVANGVQQPKVIVSGERPGNGNAKANGNANGSQKGNGNGKANGNGNGNGKARGKLK